MESSRERKATAGNSIGPGQEKIAGEVERIRMGKIAAGTEERRPFAPIDKTV
jgi:hypothetical protein